MNASIIGRDPATGDILDVEYDQRVLQVHRRQDAGEADLPFLASGLIDLQVNGFGGHDVNGADVEAGTIEAITDELARRGVTTWLPTVVTASEEAISNSLRAIAAARDRSPLVAAAVPFAHVEGPFLSDQDGPRGIHDRDQIRPIDADEVLRWTAAGPVGIVTISPHWPDTAPQIAKIVAAGVTVAIGHTHATGDQITAAVDAGATLSTHLGNGIHPTLPRHPNPIWTQLADDRLRCGLIADGHHLPAETLEVMLRAKGPGRAFLVSDSTELAGMAPGEYQTAVGGTVELSGSGRLSYVGTELLAGAASDVAAGLKFVLRATTLGLAGSLRLVTSTPAQVLGRSGAITVGAPADLVLLDNTGTIQQVIQQGQLIR